MCFWDSQSLLTKSSCALTTLREVFFGKPLCYRLICLISLSFLSSLELVTVSYSSCISNCLAQLLALSLLFIFKQIDAFSYSPLMLQRASPSQKHDSIVQMRTGEQREDRSHTCSRQNIILPVTQLEITIASFFPQPNTLLAHIKYILN